MYLAGDLCSHLSRGKHDYLRRHRERTWRRCISCAAFACAYSSISILPCQYLIRAISQKVTGAVISAYNALILVHILPAAVLMSNTPPTPSATTTPTTIRPSVFRNMLALLRGREIVISIVLLTLGFALLTSMVLRTDLLPTPWDIRVTHELQEVPHFPLGLILTMVSYPGFAPWNWIMAGVVIAIMVVLRRPVEAVFMCLAALGGLSAEIIKNLIDRPRPTPEFATIATELHSYSFPSGHVTGYTIIFGFIFYLAYTLLPKHHWVRWFLLIFSALMILLVGPSRVYMGQHWTSDALAGYTLGFAYLLALIEVHRFWLKRAKPAPEESAA
jgi:membrane-associated phospholipid phosphatase